MVRLQTYIPCLELLATNQIKLVNQRGEIGVGFGELAFLQEGAGGGVGSGRSIVGGARPQ